MKDFGSSIRPGRRRLQVLAMTLLLIWLQTGVGTFHASATVLSGSLRSSLYLQESRVGAGWYEARVRYEGLTDTTQVPQSQRHPLEGRVRLVEEARLDVAQLACKPLGFHTALSAGNVLTDQSLRHTAFRVYRAYFQWNGLRRGPGLGYDLRLGRHWVLAGVGSGTIDGLSATVGDSRLGDIAVFAGTLGVDRILRTDRFWSLDDPDQSRTFGGRLRLRRPIGPVEPTLAFSAAQADRKPRAELLTDARKVGLSAELRASRTGAWRALRGLRAWGDWRRDLIFGRDLSMVGGLDYSGDLSRWFSWLPLPVLGQDFRGRVEYGRRRPDLRATSHFASFLQNPICELRGGAGATVVPGVRLDVDGDYACSDDGEKQNGVAINANGYGLTVGYRLHRGYGGDLDGWRLCGHRELYGKVTVDAVLGHSQYDYGDLQEVSGFDPELVKDTSGLLALGYRLRPDLSLTGQVEGLRNRAMLKDLRFLGIVNWRFRTAL